MSERRGAATPSEVPPVIPPEVGKDCSRPDWEASLPASATEWLTQWRPAFRDKFGHIVEAADRRMAGKVPRDVVGDLSQEVAAKLCVKSPEHFERQGQDVAHLKLRNCISSYCRWEVVNYHTTMAEERKHLRFAGSSKEEQSITALFDNYYAWTLPRQDLSMYSDDEIDIALAQLDFDERVLAGCAFLRGMTLRDTRKLHFASDYSESKFYRLSLKTRLKIKRSLERQRRGRR